MKTFKGGKMLLYRNWGNSTTRNRHGQSYIWQTFSSHNVCMVTERLKCLVCITDVLPQSKQKFVTNDIVTGGRLITSLAKHNDVAQLWHAVSPVLIWPILTLFVANCSWILLDSFKAIKTIMYTLRFSAVRSQHCPLKYRTQNINWQIIVI